MSGLNSGLGGGGGGGGGGWELVTSSTLGSAATSITVSSLQGNTYAYRFIVHVERTTGTAVEYHMSPNGTTSNLDSRYASIFGSISSLNDADDIRWALMNGAASARLMVDIYWPTGNGRRLCTYTTAFDSDGLYVGLGDWNESSTELTSMVFETDGAGTAAQSYNTGSWVRVYRHSLT